MVLIHSLSNVNALIDPTDNKTRGHTFKLVNKLALWILLNITLHIR